MLGEQLLELFAGVLAAASVILPRKEIGLAGVTVRRQFTYAMACGVCAIIPHYRNTPALASIDQAQLCQPFNLAER